jgi:hypothetical protein
MSRGEVVAELERDRDPEFSAAEDDLLFFVETPTGRATFEAVPRGN